MCFAVNILFGKFWNWSNIVLRNVRYLVNFDPPPLSFMYLLLAVIICLDLSPKILAVMF